MSTTTFVMKKVINKPGDEVKEMVEGMVLAFPWIIRKDPKWNNVYRRESPIPGKVSLVSGGGSGHEPAHAGYVGKGMLDAACAGETYTSPTVPQILDAIKAVASDAGVLVIIKNFAGDVMNFTTAAKMARAQGIKTDWVIVNDDVAIPEPAKRRGIAGTVFVHKIAGAAAEELLPLEEVKKIAQTVIDNVRSMSVALTPCVVPKAGKPTFELGPDEMEVGIGIHGEKGVERRKIMPSREIAELLVGRIVEDLKLDKGEEVAVIVQGNGGTPYMEKFIFYRDVHKVLTEKYGIKIYRAWVGEFMTSLEMAGVAVSILRLVDPELKRYLDAPALTIAIHTPGPVTS